MRNLSLKDLKKNKKKKKGFTLVELIIVIAIMAILAAVAIPKFGQVTTNANITADVSTAKSIHSLAIQYLAEEPTMQEADITNKVIQNFGDGSEMPKSKITGLIFTIEKDSTGKEIIVKSDGKEVYPNQDEDTFTKK